MMAARKKQGRRVRRRRSRITPRRWLPFVVLMGVAAGAVVVERTLDDDPVPTNAVELASTRLPVAAEPGALSTAWYCSGGTAQGDEGIAELSAVIANGSPEPTTARVAVVDSEGNEATTTVDVPAQGRTRVTASDVLTAEWVGMVIEVLGGDVAVEREVVGPNGYDVSPCSSNAATEWFVPSGSTEIGAQEYLLLFNPFPGATSVDIDFATDEGALSPRPLQGLSVAGRSVRLVPLESLPARRAEIATRVAARSGRLVVDRVQIYDGTGDPMTGRGDDAVDTDPPRGVASTTAIPEASVRWLFPHARADEGTRTKVAVFNPGERTAEVDVIITYEDPTRMPEVEPVALTLPAGEQRTVDLTDVPGIEVGADFTVAIDSFGVDGVRAQPVVAEQLVFNRVRTLAPEPTDEVPDGEAPPEGEEVPEGEAPPDDPGTGDGVPPEQQGPTTEFVPGFAVVPGASVAATEWFLPSRGGTSTRRAAVVVANPSAAAIEVTVEAVVDGRREPVEGATVKIPGHDRRTLDLSGLGASPALRISADGPVVVAASSVSTAGLGASVSLASPMPSTVVLLPPLR